MSKKLFIGGSFIFFLTSACASFDVPDNLELVAQGLGYQAQYREPDVARSQSGLLRSARMNAQKCLPFGGDAGIGSSIMASSLQGERLSRNDLLDVRIAEDETFNGSYVVSRDGMLKLPFLPPIRAQGRSTDQVETDISNALLAEEFYPESPRISVRTKDFAAVSIGVSGAVFEPHAVEIGGMRGDIVDSIRQATLGASTDGRNLSVALRAAGGVRPDADMSAVELRRNGQVHRLDMRGVFDGKNSADVMLLTGDEVSVTSRKCFQDDLMRPSPISPPGIDLFLSNLTHPALSASAAGGTVRQVPYGSRYMQVIIDANCVGGSRATSANRSVVLFSRNPLTGVSVVIERQIEDLLRRADRDDFDPYLLPGDAMACYDSTITNIAEIARVLGLFNPVRLR
jgi:polysaccharide export outer membrane protein